MNLATIREALAEAVKDRDACSNMVGDVVGIGDVRAALSVKRAK